MFVYVFVLSMLVNLMGNVAPRLEKDSDAKIQDRKSNMLELLFTAVYLDHLHTWVIGDLLTLKLSTDILFIILRSEVSD